MRTMNEELVSIIETAIISSLKVFESNNKENSLSDLYLSFEREDVVLSVFDDMENKLLDVNLENEQREEDAEAFEKRLKSVIKSTLSQLEQNHLFDAEFIFKPFAVSWVDDDFIVSEELIFIDDNTLKLDGDLLVNLDKELDEFLKNLMK